MAYQNDILSYSTSLAPVMLVPGVTVAANVSFRGTFSYITSVIISLCRFRAAFISKISSKSFEEKFGKRR